MCTETAAAATAQLLCGCYGKISTIIPVSGTARGCVVVRGAIDQPHVKSPHSLPASQLCTARNGGDAWCEQKCAPNASRDPPNLRNVCAVCVCVSVCTHLLRVPHLLWMCKQRRSVYKCAHGGDVACSGRRARMRECSKLISWPPPPPRHRCAACVWVPQVPSECVLARPEGVWRGGGVGWVKVG